ALVNSEDGKPRVIAARNNIRRVHMVPNGGRYPKRAGAGLDQLGRREQGAHLRASLAGQPAGQTQGTGSDVDRGRVVADLVADVEKEITDRIVPRVAA